MKDTIFKIMSEEIKNLGDHCDIDHNEKWIDVNRGDFHLYIQFDEKGNHLESIGMFKDVFQVVDQIKLF